MGKAGMKRSVVLALVLALGACAAPPIPPAMPPPAPPPAPPPPRPTPPVLRPSDDQCGAAELQSLVGKSKTEIPIPLMPSMRRVVCTSCPMTQDYRPDRQTILFDAATGLVTAVKCG